MHRCRPSVDSLRRVKVVPCRSHGDGQPVWHFTRESLFSRQWRNLINTQVEDADFRIELDLQDHGWAYCSITTSEGRFQIGSFGDCTDAFGDLVRAGLLIATGAYAAQVSFDGEPMEWRLVVERRQFHPMLVKVVTFPDIYSQSPDDDGDLLFSVQCTPDAFSKAVAVAAQALLDEIGIEGFANRWRLTGFPLRALRALQSALPIEEPQPIPPDFTGTG
jgi:hypothetical protein